MRNHYAPLQLPAPGPRTPDPDYPEVDVALVMESTYPYLKGGVSAVVHDIIVENPSISSELFIFLGIVNRNLKTCMVCPKTSNG